MGHGWIHDLERLRRLETFVDDADSRALWHEIKQENKKDLAAFIKERLGMTVDPQSMFDVLVKRIHEYKRQQLIECQDRVSAADYPPGLMAFTAASAFSTTGAGNGT